MSSFIVECDKCEHQFVLSSELINVQDVIPIGKAHYFSCPSCGFKYVYMIEDREQHNYMLEIKSLQDRIDVKRNRDMEVSPFLMKRFQKVLDESNNHQVFLRDRYQKVVTDQLNQSDSETNS